MRRYDHLNVGNEVWGAAGVFQVNIMGKCGCGLCIVRDIRNR